MKSFREKYFEDYQAEQKISTNKKGYEIEYVYTGEWFGWNDSTAALKKRKFFYIISTFLCTAIALWCGVQHSPANSTGLVAVPGLVSLVSFMYTWIGVIQFCISKELIQAKDCRRMYAFIEKGSLITFLCYLLCFGSSFFILIQTNFFLISILVTLGFALCAGLSLFLYIRHKTLSYEKRVDAKNTDSGEL